MINAKNKELIEVAQINDFIISSKTISMILAQISEQKRINDFYAEIFDSEGVEIYLKPVKNYIKTGIETNFYTVLKAAFEVGQVAFGYKLKKYEFNKEKNFGIVINPVKYIIFRKPVLLFCCVIFSIGGSFNATILYSFPIFSGSPIFFITFLYILIVGCLRPWALVISVALSKI